jgi:hypothetical protein
MQAAHSVAEPSGDATAEREAAAKLEAMSFGGKKYLVISGQVSPDLPDRCVTCVNFCGAPVNEEALTLVPKLYRVITVSASGSKLTNDQLKYFSGLSNLTNLILDGTSISDEGLSHLRP